MSQSNHESFMACKLDGTCVAINGEPADSIELKIGEDIDWTDVSSVYERDDSLKETTNPKSHNHTNSSTKSGSNSQRFSGNLKPSIIGLPGKIQNSGFLGHSSRRPASIRIFPKKVKTGGGGKQAVPETEPGSPKVSCIGKVLSERERVRRRLRQKPAKVKTPAKKEEEKRTSCWATVAGIFWGGRRRKQAEKKGGVIASSREREKEVEAKERRTPVTVEAEEAVPPPAGIGGMKRFTSGRKVEWDFELAEEEEGKR